MQGGEQTGAAGAENENVGRERLHVHALPMLASTAARRAAASALTCACSEPPCESMVTSSGPKPLMRNFHKDSRDAGRPVDLLDRLDPGGLQRRGAADHGQVSAAQIAEGLERGLAHAALADDQLDAVAFHQRPREAFHAHRGGGADAERLVAGGVAGARVDLAHIGRGVDDGMALEVEARGASAVEHRDQRGIANAEQRLLERDGVADAKRAYLLVADRHVEDVVRHVAHSNSMPPGVMIAVARRAEWH